MRRKCTVHNEERVFIERLGLPWHQPLVCSIAAVGVKDKANKAPFFPGALHNISTPAHMHLHLYLHTRNVKEITESVQVSLNGHPFAELNSVINTSPPSFESSFNNAVLSDDAVTAEAATCENKRCLSRQGCASEHLRNLTTHIKKKFIFLLTDVVQLHINEMQDFTLQHNKHKAKLFLFSFKKYVGEIVKRTPLPLPSMEKWNNFPL